MKLSDTRVHGPQIRARLGTTAHFCKVVFLRSPSHCVMHVPSVGQPRTPTPIFSCADPHSKPHPLKPQRRHPNPPTFCILAQVHPTRLTPNANTAPRGHPPHLCSHSSDSSSEPYRGYSLIRNTHPPRITRHGATVGSYEGVISSERGQSVTPEP